MDCPKCMGKMHLVSYGPKIRVNRCENCKGLFARPDMLKAMLEGWMADEIIDCGSKKVGKQFDMIDDIDCPQCHIPMDKIYDKRQTHIWLESCTRCGGIFLDAGEFTDLKHVTLLDFFRDIIKGKRPLEGAAPRLSGA